MNGSVWQRQHFLDMEENRWDSHVFDEEELGRDPFDEQAFDPLIERLIARTLDPAGLDWESIRRDAA